MPAKKKPAAKKPAAKKKIAKKPAAKKPAAKKTAKKKTAAKKPAAKKAAKKPAKKATKAAKKAPAKKAAAKPAPKPVKKITKVPKPRNSATLSYTQSEFIAAIQGFCGIEKKSEAKEICEDIQAFITDALKKGYKLPLLGLGKMYVRKTKARVGRNPATGEVIQIPAKKRVRFSPAKALKESVL